MECMQGPPKSGLSEADKAVLEERTLKMRKAMGENLADDIASESPDTRERRLNLIRCGTIALPPRAPWIAVYRDFSSILVSFLSKNINIQFAKISRVGHTQE